MQLSEQLVLATRHDPISEIDGVYITPLSAMLIFLLYKLQTTHFHLSIMIYFCVSYSDDYLVVALTCFQGLGVISWFETSHLHTHVFLSVCH